jgi:hypothetical protein
MPLKEGIGGERDFADNFNFVVSPTYFTQVD